MNNLQPFRTQVCILISLLVALAGCSKPAEVSPTPTTPATTIGPLTFSQTQIRVPIPGSDKSVGYLQIYNSAQNTINLVSATSAQIRAIEFHQTVERDGLLRMRRLPSIELASGTTTHFAPGGRHLMLFGVGPVSEPVHITFVDDQAQDYAVEFKVVDILQNSGDQPASAQNHAAGLEKNAKQQTEQNTEIKEQ